MSKYQIAMWFCKDCAWLWKTLSADRETEDQCPSCNSYRSQRIIKPKDTKTLV